MRVIGNATLYLGDCRGVMEGFVSNAFDSIVTDPPYGLGFMGKGWDHGVPGVEFWTEALRIAKPGAHLLAFGGTRTFHRLACAIEDAGFEIRDCVMWVYGSGFPKSLDVSKAIDKARTEDREPVRAICRAVRAAMQSAGLVSRDLTQHFDDCHPRLVDHWAARDTDSQPSLPTWEQWLKLRAVLNMGDELDAEVWRLNGRKGTPGEAWNDREFYETPTGGLHGGTGNTVGAFGLGRQAKPGGATDAARQWQGWGTALKPAWEPIIVARKPLSGTVASNVIQHGTGALNIDGCRVSGAYETRERETVGGRSMFGLGAGGGAFVPTEGRWPANLVHDGSAEVAACFPSDAPSGGRAHEIGEAVKGQWREQEGRTDPHTRQSVYSRNNDTGSAARFFYCAKASASDRNGLTEKYLNKHPTVKPTELMRYLCRLVTPPGGTVFDPFTGSGSTGVAALADGFRFVGVELEQESLNTACERITNAQRQERMFA